MTYPNQAKNLQINLIFNNDPLDQKKVVIWMGSINPDAEISGSLKYTQGGAQFPMSNLLFRKTEK